MATHSSVLAWRIPGMGEPGGLPSRGSHRVGHDWSDLAAVCQLFLNKTDKKKKNNTGLGSVCAYLCVQSHSCVHSCNTMDCNLTGSSVYEIPQARILEWIAISSSGDFPHPRTEPMSPASSLLHYRQILYHCAIDRK